MVTFTVSFPVLISVCETEADLIMAVMHGCELLCGTVQLTHVHVWQTNLCMQVIIMLTPVSSFFTVYYQNWQEWLFAIGVSAGCMLLSLLVKLISR